MSKFKVGDKIVPVDKSYPFSGLSNSNAWRNARNYGQYFLYVSGFIQQEGKTYYVCDMTIVDVGGDYFLEKELVPYKPKLKKFLEEYRKENK